MSGRLALPTLQIRNDAPLTIRYRGRSYRGWKGDTIATALFAGGVRVFSRSLKYHRPRGLYSLDGESANTYMAVDGQPNVCAENTPAKDGMRVEAQNVIGSPEFDLLGILDRFDWAMPAGFYYRRFHKPARLWPLAAERIRKAAGLGRIAPDFRMSGTFEECYPSAEVCVIGGGPAGLKAALTAAARGLRVILLEARPFLGGCFAWRRGPGSDTALYERAAELERQAVAAPNLRIFRRAAVVGLYPDNLVTACQQGGDEETFTERYIEIQARSVVVATGCMERPLLFEHNERPGVMQAGCAHRLARQFGILPGRTAVFSIADDLGLEAAADLFDLGLNIACVADARRDGQDPQRLADLEARNIPYYPGWVAVESCGRPQVRRVRLAPVAGNLQRSFDCDLIVASAGLTPVTGPLAVAGAALAYDAHTGFFLPRPLPENVHAAGRMLGLQDAAAVLVSGQLAGLQAAEDCGIEASAEIPQASAALAARPGPPRGSQLLTAPVKGAKSFLCFDEDATVKTVNQALANGFDVPELIKRYAAVGTGPGQSAIPGHNLPLYVAMTQASPDPQPRPTTVRAPLVPAAIAALAGSGRHPVKRTPLHELQKSAGGRMETVGAWRRARTFSDDARAAAEIEAVRHRVGMLDASTLGKFRLFGSDALKVLQRIYVSDMRAVTGDRVKYAAMCNEDGCLVDDGVVVRRGPNDYYLTTSTARADMTAEWLRYHTRFDNWQFAVVNLTDAFGVINLAGPRARAVLQQITAADLADEAFPFLGYREFRLQGDIPVRAMRLGFVGELSFELHVPASAVESVWQMLLAAGRPYELKPFGLEAQSTLRLEKGHVIIGSESEQRTTLHDLGLGFLWHRDKPEARTVGAAALRQTEHQPGRLKLVGFEMTDPADRAPRDGAAVVDDTIRGYVCTARFSRTLNKPIGLALVEARLAANGGPLQIYEDGCGGRRIHARVVPRPFYDPEGRRMRG